MPKKVIQKKSKSSKKSKASKNKPLERVYTVNLHKRLHTITWKKRAPRALREIRKFAVKEMGTEDVRIEPTLNSFLWSKGIRYVPKRVRVSLSRKINEDKDSANRMYTLVTHIPVESFEGLKTEIVGK